jgi:hypothetical protein
MPDRPPGSTGQNSCSPHSYQTQSLAYCVVNACVNGDLFRNAAVTYALPNANLSMQERRGFEDLPGRHCLLHSRRDTSHAEAVPAPGLIISSDAPYHDLVPGEWIASLTGLASGSSHRISKRATAMQACPTPRYSIDSE